MGASLAPDSISKDFRAGSGIQLPLTRVRAVALKITGVNAILFGLSTCRVAFSDVLQFP